MSDYYASRLATQAIRVSHLRDRLNHEMDVLTEMVKGTPPNLFPPEWNSAASPEPKP